jgi:hypothetical protein
MALTQEQINNLNIGDEIVSGEDGFGIKEGRVYKVKLIHLDSNGDRNGVELEGFPRVGWFYFFRFKSIKIKEQNIAYNKDRILTEDDFKIGDTLWINGTDNPEFSDFRAVSIFGKEIINHNTNFNDALLAASVIKKFKSYDKKTVIVHYTLEDMCVKYNLNELQHYHNKKQIMLDEEMQAWKKQIDDGPTIEDLARMF